MVLVGGNWQKPTGTLTLHTFRVYGDTNIIALAGSEVGVQFELNHYYSSAQLWVGDINWIDRTVTNWQRITGNTQILAQARPKLHGFFYDVADQVLWLASHNRDQFADINLYRLPLGSHSATHINQALNSYSSYPFKYGDATFFNLIGDGTVGTQSYRAVRMGDKIWFFHPSGSTWTILTSTFLPGAADLTINYGSMMTNPDNHRQIFMVKVSTAGVSIERSDFTPVVNDYALVITNFLDIIHLGDINAAQANMLSTGGASAGLLVGPTRKYDVQADELTHRIYPRISTDTKALIGFILATTPTNTEAAVQYRGILTGLTGLSIGDNYIVEGKNAGVAISSTEVILRALPL